MSSEIYKIKAPYYYKNLSYKRGICPVAENIQPKLMQFVTNYRDVSEASVQIKALKQTIDFFT